MPFFKRRKLNRITTAMASALDVVSSPYWQIDNEGRVSKNRVVLDGVTEKKPYTPRLSVQETQHFSLSQSVGESARALFTKTLNTQLQGMLNDISAVLERVPERLRTAELKGLIFQSHTLHRKAAIEALRKVSDEELQALLQTYGSRIRELSVQPTNTFAFDSDTAIPRDARFVVHGRETICVVIEQRPQVRTVEVRYGDTLDRRTIALPYVIFMVYVKGGAVQKVRCAFSNYRLDALDQKLSQPALPHVESDFQVCYGSFPSQPGTLSEVCGTAVDTFWTSEFMMREPNGHSHDRYAEKTFSSAESNISSFAIWEQLTKEHGLLAGVQNRWLVTPHSPKDYLGRVYKERALTQDEHVDKAAWNQLIAEMSRDLLMQLSPRAERLALNDQLQAQLDDLTKNVSEEVRAELGAFGQKFQSEITATALGALVARAVQHTLKSTL